MPVDSFYKIYIGDALKGFITLERIDIFTLLVFPSRDKVYLSFIQASVISVCKILLFPSFRFSIFLLVSR